MSDEEPRSIYIRYRNRGGVIFRINNPKNLAHSSMERIGSVNLRSGEVELLPAASLDDHDLAQIEAWVIARREFYATSRARDVSDLIEKMNLVTHWYLNEASDEEIESTSEDLLLSLTDLRNSILRKKSKLDGAR